MTFERSGGEGRVKEVTRIPKDGLLHGIQSSGELCQLLLELLDLLAVLFVLLLPLVTLGLNSCDFSFVVLGLDIGDA